MTKLEQLRDELKVKSGRLAGIFEKCKTSEGDYDFMKTGELEGTPKDRVEKVRELNAELNGLGTQITELEEKQKLDDEIKKRNQEVVKQNRPELPGKSTPAEKQEYKSFGQRFIESKAFQKKGEVATLEDFEFKTLMSTTAGWAPESTRTGKVVDDAQRPVQVTEIFPSGNTGQAAVVYMEETTFTSNAAEAAEAGSYGESALALTERSSTVRKIATFLPVTDEQLEDEAQVSGYIDRRLRFMLMQRLDGQLLTGNGVAPNLTGVLNVSGVQTQAKGGDTVPDAVYKAMDLVRVTGRATPTYCVFHPNDWQAIRLLKTTTGAYVWGAPMDSGVQRIWGVPVVLSDAITENTGLVGDFAMHSELVTRRGIDVQISNSHSTYFVEGKQAIRADIRVALVIYRPEAFCTVTGI